MDRERVELGSDVLRRVPELCAAHARCREVQEEVAVAREPVAAAATAEGAGRRDRSAGAHRSVVEDRITGGGPQGEEERSDPRRAVAPVRPRCLGTARPLLPAHAAAVCDRDTDVTQRSADGDRGIRYGGVSDLQTRSQQEVSDPGAPVREPVVLPCLSAPKGDPADMVRALQNPAHDLPERITAARIAGVAQHGQQDQGRCRPSRG